MKLLSWAGFALGIWILLTPWAAPFAYRSAQGTGAIWISVVCGVAIAILCLIRAVRAE